MISIALFMSWRCDRGGSRRINLLKVVARLHEAADLFQRHLDGYRVVVFNQAGFVGQDIVANHLAEPVGKIPGPSMFAKRPSVQLRQRG